MEAETCRSGWGRALFRPPVGILLFIGLLFSNPAFATTSTFINEFHYDNVSDDSGEGVEVAGLAGTSLIGWSLVFYNGANGTAYGSQGLGGIIPDEGAGYGTLFFLRDDPLTSSVESIQNGSPDGIALVQGTTVIQFLSYEGTMTATNGPANGSSSTDIGVAEDDPVPPVGHSLQLSGTGVFYEDFSWSLAALNSFGSVNTGQIFTDQAPIPTPEPSTFALFGIAGLALLLRKRLLS